MGLKLAEPYNYDVGYYLEDLRGFSQNHIE